MYTDNPGTDNPGATTKTVQNVLQVNIRLSEGGAAGVARTLADELRRVGIRSPFAYGYGKRGRASPLEAEYDGVRVTPAAIAALNRISYSTRGVETGLVSPHLWHDFAKSVEASDVVHLHAIHSYFAPTERLLSDISRAGKPVVWTLHDQWIMTGRCAQPGTCRLWQDGCPKCPDLAAYPPAKFDHAAERWQQRYAAVRLLQQSVPTSIVACADWLADEAVTAGIDNVTVVKNSVDRQFWDALEAHPRVHTETTRNLFLCRDLRDENKVDWELLTAIAAVPYQSLTIVGDNPEANPDYTPTYKAVRTSAEYRPAIMNRVALAKLMREHDRLIFTSQVDYFPLTIAEALTAGLAVFAVDSQAAREFRAHPRVTLFDSADSLYAALQANPRDDDPDPSARPTDAAPLSLDRTSDLAVPDFFAPSRMAAEYRAIYDSLLTR
ncbi:colanic acid biosynthesis glycosyltransferase WcaC [Cryobacterium melibiosiphilum]|uniref:Colanic acid biosynthesis glycosyltransferase WcaC n=1 Tax=Cryobacterium melibiosiphilum TaxID=995039 RepID=A0A3A5N157_9MICO|nr:glycosyltransferase [Cryobacterium melibiosiphilum]RJT91024.1 colanic acid biosynthesis glycosyltransferase WcaC [Cryobacterium melibiosiphilum]